MRRAPAGPGKPAGRSLPRAGGARRASPASWWGRTPQAAAPRRAGGVDGRRCAAAGPGPRRARRSPAGFPGATLPVPRRRRLQGPRGLSPARWPQRRPSASIAQPGPRLRAPPGMMQGRRHHRHRRRLRASREPPSRSRGGRRPLRRTPGLAPRLPRAPSPPSSGLAPAAPPRDLRAPRRARCLRLAHRPFRGRRRPEVAGRADGLERRVRAGAPTAPAGAWAQGVAAPHRPAARRGPPGSPGPPLTGPRALRGQERGPRRCAPGGRSHVSSWVTLAAASSVLL